MVFDCAAIGDIDYTASMVLSTAIAYLQRRHVRVAFCSVLGPVSQQLDHYGISQALDPGACYDSPGATHQAFRAASRTTGEG